MNAWPDAGAQTGSADGLFIDLILSLLLQQRFLNFKAVLNFIIDEKRSISYCGYWYG